MKSSKKNDLGIKEDELFATDCEKYGEDYNKHLLDQYMLYVEMADKISSRRAIANTFFLSINTVLVAILGILSSGVTDDMLLFRIWVIAVASAAICMSWTWRALIRSYRELNSAKFAVINTIEKYLPASGFAAEWSFLKSPERKEQYQELTKTESWVPAVFLILYLTLIVVTAVDLISLLLYLR